MTDEELNNLVVKSLDSITASVREAVDSGMTNDQKAHLIKIATKFVKQIVPKYIIGQNEHGGNLFEVPRLNLIRFNLEEAVDSYVYGSTEEENEIDRLRAIDAKKKASLTNLKEEASHLQ